MKRITLLSLSLIFAAASVNAASTPTLADNMKQIGKLFKALQSQVNDSKKNGQSASDAAQLVELFTTVENQVPDTITSLPSDQQAAAIADYKALIEKEIESSKALETDFDKGNNSDAAAILKSMNTVRSEGHDKYRN